jgi:hypothetical protein
MVPESPRQITGRKYTYGCEDASREMKGRKRAYGGGVGGVPFWGGEAQSPLLLARRPKRTSPRMTNPNVQKFFRNRVGTSPPSLRQLPLTKVDGSVVLDCSSVRRLVVAWVLHWNLIVCSTSLSDCLLHGSCRGRHPQPPLESYLL